jgi:tetratricopeptide (TPR) repeat protein
MNQDGSRGTKVRWITSIPTVVEAVIKVFLLAILLLVGIVVGLGLWQSWISNAQGITMHSFTETGANMRGEKSRSEGDDIADSLEAALLQIAEFHTLINPWGSPKDLPSLQMTGPQTIQRVGGTITFPGIELPVEMVVEIFRVIFARPRTQYTITGSFQKVSSDTKTDVEKPTSTAKDACPRPFSDKERESTEKDDCLSFPRGPGTRVQITVRLESDGRMLKRWSCKSLITNKAEGNAETPSYLEQHLREISYEIMWIVLEKVEANSLKNFKCYIRGVELFRQYKDKQKSFDEAESTLLNVVYNNKASARGYFYLGNLYNWRSYYEANEKDEDYYRERAKEMYGITSKKATTNSVEALALSEFGMGLIYYRHYSKEKKNGKDPDTDLLDKADTHFTDSYQKDKKFYFSRTGKALVYKARSEITKIKIKERKRYIDDAIEEFQYAKEISQDLKDIDSVKWLDRQIRDLEFKKQDMLIENGVVRPALQVD